jgi:hypothetical protein
MKTRTPAETLLKAMKRAAEVRGGPTIESLPKLAEPRQHGKSATTTAKATRKTLQSSKTKDKSAMPTSGYLMVFAVVVLIAGGVGYWYYRKKHKVVQDQEGMNAEEAEMQRQWEEEQKQIPDPQAEAQAGQYVEQLPYDEKSVFHPQGDSDAEEGDETATERRGYSKKHRRNRSLESMSQTSESNRGSERERDRETVKSSHKSKSSKGKSKGKSRSSSKDKSKSEGRKKKKKKPRPRSDEREESGMTQQRYADPYPVESDAYDLGTGYHAHGQGSVPWIPDGRYTPASEMPTQQATTFAQAVGSYR